MRSVLALALVAAATGACRDDVEMFPIGPGGFGTGGGTTPDAGGDAAGSDGGGMISGRVCLITDARTPTLCADTGADGLSVVLGTATATTSANGSFMIANTGGTGLVWRVSGDAIYGAAMQLTLVNLIPAISATVFEDMVVSTNATIGDGSGSVIARFTHNNAGVSGISAVTTPDPVGQIYYDGANAVMWETAMTGSFGVVWVPGVSPSNATLTVSGAVDDTITGIPVFADTATFVLVTVP